MQPLQLDGDQPLHLRAAAKTHHIHHVPGDDDGKGDHSDHRAEGHQHRGDANEGVGEARCRDHFGTGTAESAALIASAAR